MSEDAVRAELQGLRNDGQRREKKLDEVLVNTGKIEGRVVKLEAVVDSHGIKLKRHEDKIEKIEKRIWQFAAIVLALHGGAREILKFFI
jgi:peptidoglycan hydrolase CwlO-like protein